jgi:HEAT repeat protein
MEVVRLYHPSAVDRVAIVSVEPAALPEHALVRLATGRSSQRLLGGTSYGPFPLSEIETRFNAVVAQLTAQGYQVSGVVELLAALDHQKSVTRARAALRLGWKRSTEAVPALLAKIDSAVDDLCSLIDALGEIGDPRAAPALRQQATRKLLSRRRSAIEALRKLNDVVGINEALQQTTERLPDVVRTAHSTAIATGVSQPLAAAFSGVESLKTGLYLDDLYELGTPVAGEAVRRVLGSIAFAQPYVWRYVKSILKRAMLRHDAVMFGWLAVAIERQAKTSKGVTATVKSGYDGKERPTKIFGRATKNYVRRSCWRYLRELALYRPEHYVPAAAEVLVNYSVDDARVPRGMLGQFASCYLLSRILYDNSARFTYDDRRMTFRFAPPHRPQPAAGAREEAYTELWDVHPRGYLRLLAAAQLPEVHAFALAAIRRAHANLVQQATPDELSGMLSAPVEETMQLALAELRRRFDPRAPDWALIDRVVRDERDFVVALAHDWLRQTSALWSRDADRTARYLQSPDGRIQLLVAELVAAHLDDVGTRRRLAERLLECLRDPDAQHLAGIARVARTSLLQELGSIVTLDELLALLASDSPEAQAVGADVLANRPDALRELGITRVAVLAEHPVFAVRAAAHRLLAAASGRLREDPSILFLLVESRWLDTRAAAMRTLRSVIDWSQLDLTAFMGLVDSNQPDVQQFAIEQIETHFARLDAGELALRLAQHPSAALRRRALRIVSEHLPAGVESLRRIEHFFRACLFDTWPRRSVKWGALELLVARGMGDEEQAEMVASLLDEFIRVNSAADFERALESLSRLQLKWPHLVSSVALAQEAQA